MFQLSKRSKSRLSGVNCELLLIVNMAIEVSKVDFGIPESGGVRTPEMQNELFKSGRSQLDGYEKKSAHQTGDAFDFYAYVNGKATWEPVYMSQVACAILQVANDLGIRVQWGGLWENFIDQPHFELVK